jgi:hypothetical protein
MTHNNQPPTNPGRFKPNSTGLFAVVECIVPIAEGTAVLFELIVSGKGEEKHIAIEDISGVTA